MTMTQTQKTLSPKVQGVVDKVKALREYTRTTSFRTTRSQHDLIQTLDGSELADALIAIKDIGGTY